MTAHVETNPEFTMRFPGTWEELNDRCHEASQHLMMLSQLSDVICMLREQVSEGRHEQAPEQFYATLALLDAALHQSQPQTMAAIHLCETVANATIQSQLPNKDAQR